MARIPSDAKMGGRLLALLAATAALAGAPGESAVGAETPCEDGCPPPILAEPEPALRRAVHLAWSEPHAPVAVDYEIERRARGAAHAWELVARVAAGRARHQDDRGPGARGLAPGEYEYRIRGRYRIDSLERWSAWSPPQAVRIVEACPEVGRESADLPRVVADDLDGDGRYTGEDLARALRRCAGLGGCILEALPVSYDDVAIVISNGGKAVCTAQRTACLSESFPKGLEIEGHGRSTVLRSPLWRTPYLPEPLLEIVWRPDLRLHLRHLVLDGRKREQVAPLAGQNNHHTWRHFGLQVWNQWSDHDKPNRQGCVHDVLVREFMSRGISLADVARWNVERSSIEGIGCDAKLTPCPRLALPDPFPTAPGYVSTGVGISVAWHSDDVILRANRVRRATKYAIALKHGQDGAETTIRRPRILDNDIAQTGQLGFFIGGVSDGSFEGNRIAATDSLNRGPEGRASSDTFGISCNGALERTGFRRNRIEDMAGMAISWNCFGRDNYLAETQVLRSCRQKGPRGCTPGRQGSCYLASDLEVGSGAAGSLALVDDVVTASGCAAPLAVHPAKPGFELLVRGGLFAAGREARFPVRFHAVDVILEGKAVFTGAPLEFGPGTRGVVAPGVVVEGTGDLFRVDPRARVLICASRRSECERLCAGPRPPAWCGGREEAR